jgi:hypothetical protein
MTLFHWGKQPSNACPRCGVPENTLDVLQCRGEKSDEVALKQVSKLHSLFDDTFTHPEIAAAITSRLTHFQQCSHPHLPPNTSFEIQLATFSQDNIGWKNLLEGLVTKKWRLAQQRYYIRESITRITSRQS